ncbi:MAG: dihydrolipoyl dehydrogenase [Sulfitobacter litoralis]|jgi:dihydrolipoamide dehydrogenase|uniref:Dihydrolipoyl dehydrogenase n=1 Tax=Sulfitobacter litoralis TaxID=335975 RepID=A0ABY0SD15_9RHOB|nr:MULTISPECIES: dihydrolipoyl dehydrogenase [Sulfitobacter]MBQ0717002.1 dihydrolipoyl dehydrogenase [Sulfitobacter litoralis]MBQ0766934.1 dihydrolipoyl dehydrogenase [Sulfitobacter litoralis]MBQ0801761.1 dihydrolipoyl dehydrogenase [Sulfitobacter litoralis]MCF7726157.1 dihydrolipoyl dehydrogenase [Sulfitobacter sp. M22]MCF7777534.1 dihydrolipoyl dehydrogenase [Sulfitobacter sp. M220]|tara:strand:- start:309 stop:1703 length:1395 start_codon:yes stop_codon:yes gene_type:complete
MAAKSFDLIVIGAGPGGYVAAIRGAQLGLSVAIVEREHLGGICLNWGCIPTKALLRSSEVFHLMQRASEFGLKADNIGYDLDAVVKRSRKVAGQLSGGIGHLMKKNKVAVFMGSASLAGKGKVTVKAKEGEETLTAKNIVLATGARARNLPGLEADGKRVWMYKDALQPPHMPKKLLVIGSGAIGIEFASFYNTLGADTTVVEVMDRILPVEDEEISKFAKKQFEKQGMKIMQKSVVKQLDRADDKVTAHIETGGKVTKHEFDTVISAVGIVGNVENLGLEDLGVKIDRTHVVTDEYCRTGVDGLYAIGDIAGAPWLAHKASHEGVMVAELIAGQHPHPVKPESIAGCTYCHPQVASVGYTEAKAKELGFDVKVGRFPFIGNGKAIALGEPEGMIKTVFDAKTGELLGAHMVGAEVTELIQGYVVGRQLETTEEDLMNTVFPHPTLSEMMHESVLDAYGRVIHM